MSDVTDKMRNSARWSAENSRHIAYRIIAQGTLVLKTPAHFGAGDTSIKKLQNGEQANTLELYKAPDGRAVLTGASIAGALRHYLIQRLYGYQTADTNKDSLIQKQFGEALDETRGAQSRLITYDATSQNSAQSERDGVRINDITRTADERALFKIKTWDAGTQFPLRLELVMYEEDTTLQAHLKQAFAVLLSAFATDEIPMGGRKNRGYGQCAVSDWRVYEYDMTSTDDFLGWVNGQYPSPTPDFLSKANRFMDNRQRVILSASFALCDSVMIRTIEKRADKEITRHLTNRDNQPILTGTSIAGALRARAFKILQTIGKSDGIAYDLFGDDGKDGDEKVRDIKSSRMIVKESVIQKADTAHIQNRVKIERFTGGSYETALINEQPVFATPNTWVKIELELRKPEPAQIGLFLLLLKDLWTEDLPLGGESNIGRGRLRGKNATLTIDGKQIHFNEHGLADKQYIDQLKGYVDALWGQL